MLYSQIKGRELLENIQDELNILDEHLEELITDMILEERDII